MDKIAKYQEAQLFIPKCEIKKNALIFNKNISYDEWEKTGQLLSQIEGATQWWIGDWLNFGEHKWGEKYKEAEKKTGFKYITLSNLNVVAKSIEINRRRLNLSWAHHQEVASFDPDKQDYWLDKAEKENWTREDLRREIRESKIEPAKPLPKKEGMVFNKDAFEFLDTFKDKSFDLLLTDPPYMTDLDNVLDFAKKWLPLALSKIKSSGRAYIFTGSYPEELHAYLTVLLKQKKFTLDNILVWTYRNTMGPSPKMGYKLNWQAIFYEQYKAFKKGKF